MCVCIELEVNSRDIFVLPAGRRFRFKAADELYVRVFARLRVFAPVEQRETATAHDDAKWVCSW